jgi:hypothetical protein
MKYKSKIDGEIVEAIQFTGNFNELEEFVGGDAEQRGNKIVVAGPNGALWLNNWDYIIKHSPGNMFYVSSPTNFNKLYKNI